MSGVTISVRKLAAALGAQPEGGVGYLHRPSGRIVWATDEAMTGEPFVVGEWVGAGAGEDAGAAGAEYEPPGPDPEDLPEDLDEDDDYLPLPDGFEIHEWDIMRRFAERQTGPLGETLQDAIRGRGAFRFFRDTIRREGIEGEWRRFFAAALEEIALGWLEEHGVPYVEPPGSR
jgi:hypothetical protein